jgi:N-acetylneuraminic acid mutarotase
MNATKRGIQVVGFITVSLLGGLLTAPTAIAAPAATLNLDQRIRCEAVIERVYWNHRAPAPERAFAQAVPQAVLRKRAEAVVLKTAALSHFWQMTVTPEQVQAELDRMAAQSQSPERLRELFAALDNDPELAAECLARPALVDRLIRTQYAHDARLHRAVKAIAERELRAIDSPSAAHPVAAVRSELAWRRGHDRLRNLDVIEMESTEFDTRVHELERTLGRVPGGIELGRASSLREDEYRFYSIIVHELDDQHARLTTSEWPKQTFDAWWNATRGTLAPAPLTAEFAYRLPTVAVATCADDSWKPTMQLLDPRYWHTAVWTGSEMIVFGGMSNVGTTYGDGSRYNPATDTWQLLPTTAAPSARQSHVAVWTGTEMVVWGGRADTSGGRYNPSTDTWSPTATNNAPQPRVNASVVWTGTQMFVWGGEGSTGLLNSGSRYDPASNSWTPMSTAPLLPRAYHTAVWTGSEMIIWNGYNVHLGELYSDGARYNPITNAWSTVAASGAPNARTYHSAVWTGTEMIVWGGANPPLYDSSGGRYNPATDTWTPTSQVDAPSYRVFHAAVWTGTEMVVQGGSFGVSAGGRYNPATDSWTPTNPVNSANNGQGITAVWTGTEMIVWGGIDDNSLFHFDGGRYNPELDLWFPTSTMNVPAARGLHAGVWTGSEMIIWGGSGWGGSIAPGGSYDPATNTWRTVSTVDAPIGSETAVWTGAEAIFWGGGPTGGRYNPTTNSWSLVSETNAPASGIGYSLVWTGTEMIVFGGIGTDTVAKRYHPATNTWTDASTVDAPGARNHHAAVWTGTEMIIWGGFINDNTIPSGGRYNPVTDVWTPTNVVGAPITRESPVSVWTGTEMIVWGGYEWLFLGDLGDGARYNPATDSWTPTNPIGAPTPRVAQGVWTGSELLLWGGTANSSGGRYDPATDAWRPTTQVNAPETRIGGRWSTVWTGEEMIIWGGIIETQRGSRYCVGPRIVLFADDFE